jgi:hypothetical protein
MHGGQWNAEVVGAEQELRTNFTPVVAFASDPSSHPEQCSGTTSTTS